MKMLVTILLCAGLLQACGQAKMQDARNTTDEAHPDALSDEEIASLENESARLENQMHSLMAESQRYQGYGSTEEELPDLGSATPEEPQDETLAKLGGGEPSKGGQDPGKNTDGGKGNCIRDFIKAIKSGEHGKAKDLLNNLKEIFRNQHAEIENKLKACKEKIRKAKKCRDKNNGGTPSDGGKGKG